MYGDARRDLFARLERQDVDDVRAARGAPSLGDLIALAAMDAARVREEQQIIVRRGGEHALHKIFFAERLPGHTAAAAPLCAVGRRRDALDIARVGERKDALFFLNEILNVDLILHVHRNPELRCHFVVAILAQVKMVDLPVFFRKEVPSVI